MIQLIFRKFGLDKSIILTILSRIFTSGSSLIGIFFITRNLSTNDQGYYYTFSSLIALQIFVELGLNYAIIQFASHEMAYLTWGRSNIIEGNEGSKRRLQSLLKFSISWFAVAAILMSAILVPAGIYYFSTSLPDSTKPNNVTLAWSALVFTSSLNLIATSLVSFLEGCGKIVEIATLRFKQVLLSSITLWLSLSAHLELLSLPISNAVTFTFILIWLWKNYGASLIDLAKFSSNLKPINWKKEILPFHWRIAVSWMSGYLITQIINPVIFHLCGAVAAGKIGMSLQITNGINAIALSWMSTKIPLYGTLVAQRKENSLNDAFKKHLIQSTIFLLFCYIALFTSVKIIQDHYPQYSIRILSLNSFYLIFIIGFLSHITSAESIYVRSHKDEPYFIISILHGITVALPLITWIKYFGIDGAIYSQLTASLCISFIGGNYIYITKRRYYLRQKNHELSF